MPTATCLIHNLLTLLVKINFNAIKERDRLGYSFTEKTAEGQLLSSMLGQALEVELRLAAWLRILVQVSCHISMRLYLVQQFATALHLELRRSP